MEGGAKALRQDGAQPAGSPPGRPVQLRQRETERESRENEARQGEQGWGVGAIT